MTRTGLDTGPRSQERFIATVVCVVTRCDAETIGQWRGLDIALGRHFGDQGWLVGGLQHLGWRHCSCRSTAVADVCSPGNLDAQVLTHTVGQPVHLVRVHTIGHGVHSNILRIDL